MPSFPHKLSYQQIAIAVLIMLFAFALRVTLLVERAAGDPYFPGTEIGYDQEQYLMFARGILDGTWPTQPYRYHPAPAYLYAAIFKLVGQSTVLLQLVYAVLDSMTVVWLIGTLWLLTKRAVPGYIAGGLFAIFPTSIMFGTSLLIASTAAGLLALTLMLYLWQRHRFVLWRTILLALCAGWLIISRKNLAPLVLLYFLWMLILPIRWRQRIVHGIIFTVIATLVVAPFTLHNYGSSGGDIILVATTGEYELYMANNRDSEGRVGSTPAQEAIDASYSQALINDIRSAPKRFIELLLYKFAAFWNNFEPPSNVNFYDMLSYSRLLQINPIRLWWIVIPGLLGLAVLFRHDRYFALILTSYIAWICFGFVLTFVTGRLRYPVVIPLMILTAYLADSLIRSLPKEWDIKSVLRRYAPVAVAIVLLLGFSHWALTPSPRLPRPRTYTELPETATALNVQFGDVTLVGWQPYAPEIWAWASNGWVPTFESYIVELFWKVDEPAQRDYLFYLAYIDEGTRYDGIDMPIGTVSWPDYPMTTWEPTTIYGEVVAIRLDDDVPEMRSGDIRVGVWYWNDLGQIEDVLSDDGQASVVLQTMAVYDPAPEVTPTAEQENHIFGDQIFITDFDLPISAEPNEIVSLSLELAALQNIDQSYRIFVHVLDADQTIVTQYDGRPMPHLDTSNWRPNYPLQTDIPLQVPDQTGSYTVYMGFYNDLGRLMSSVGDRFLLGTISVED